MGHRKYPENVMETLSAKSLMGYLVMNLEALVHAEEEHKKAVKLFEESFAKLQSAVEETNKAKGGVIETQALVSRAAPGVNSIKSLLVLRPVIPISSLKDLEALKVVSDHGWKGKVSIPADVPTGLKEKLLAKAMEEEYTIEEEGATSGTSA